MVNDFTVVHVVMDFNGNPLTAHASAEMAAMAVQRRNEACRHEGAYRAKYFSELFVRGLQESLRDKARKTQVEDRWDEGYVKALEDAIWLISKKIGLRKEGPKDKAADD